VEKKKKKKKKKKEKRKKTKKKRKKNKKKRKNKKKKKKNKKEKWNQGEDAIMVYIQNLGTTGSNLGQALYRLRFSAVFLKNARMVNKG
jgi:cbb3-type cytochrome oxidase cytochrome c subunit